MSKRYWTLLSRELATSRWVIEFGSYDKADVTAERDEYIDGWQSFKRTNLKIISSGDTQEEVAAAVAELNRVSKHRSKARSPFWELNPEGE